jgi:hypothetical protein
MTTSNIIPVKYIFLDIVAYTKSTIEAQCYIIKTLNRIVKGALNRYHISDDSVIYIPTGDGMCIALLGAGLEYDIHMTVAQEILRRVHVNNSRVNLGWKKFDIRIGINQADDNIVTDINGDKNVAGAGINNARRIMDLADANQILVSSTVYENLRFRKEYYHAFGTKFTKRVKHGLVLDIYQLVQGNITGLNVETPSSFRSIPSEPEPKLPKLAAYYFAHAIKNKEFILNKAREDVSNIKWLHLLLWFLAEDSRVVSETSAHDIYSRRVMPDDTGDYFFPEDQFNWFCENIPGDVALEVSYVVLDNAVTPSLQNKYFEPMSDKLVTNSEGEKKLKMDWPEIWDKFGLGEL